MGWVKGLGPIKTCTDLHSLSASNVGLSHTLGLRHDGANFRQPEGGSDHPEMRVQRSQSVRYGWHLTLRRDRAVRLEINCGWNRSERDDNSGGVIDDCRISVPKSQVTISPDLPTTLSIPIISLSCPGLSLGDYLFLPNVLCPSST